MKKIYVAAPGRAIPNGWPDDGRPINDLSAHEQLLVRSGDLIEMAPEEAQVEAPPEAKPLNPIPTPTKKDKTHGQ